MSSLSPTESGENVHTIDRSAHSLIYSRCEVCRCSFFYLFELYLPTVFVRICVCVVGGVTWFIHLSMFVSILLLSAAAAADIQCCRYIDTFIPRCVTCLRTNRKFDETIRLVAPSAHHPEFVRYWLRVCFIILCSIQILPFIRSVFHTPHQHRDAEMRDTGSSFVKTSDAFNCNVHAVHCAKRKLHKAQCVRTYGVNRNERTTSKFFFCVFTSSIVFVPLLYTLHVNF